MAEGVGAEYIVESVRPHLAFGGNDLQKYIKIYKSEDLELERTTECLCPSQIHHLRT